MTEHTPGTPAHIAFHINTGDYFAFLATAMGFLEEALEKCCEVNATEYERSMVMELRQDLRHVQANYKIEPRAPHEVEAIRSGNVLAS